MIRLGLVGYGYWGPKLARNFAGLEQCRVATVCDVNAKRLALAARLLPQAKMTDSYDDILNDPDIDAVLIAVPVFFHYDLAKRALLAGKDVFIEKPMTKTVAEAEELLEIAERCGRIIAIDHTFLYTGAVRKIKELFDAGEIGDLLYFDSVRINLGLFQNDVNVIYDLAPHDLSILLHLVERSPRAVMAMGKCHSCQHLHSLAYLHLDFDDGLVAHFHMSWLAPVKIRKTIIAGSKKMIVYDDLDNVEKVKVYDEGITVSSSDKESFYKTKVDYRTGDIIAPKLEHQEALTVEAENFLDCVRRRARPVADGVQGLQVVRILEAAEESLRRDGARVALEGA